MGHKSDKHISRLNGIYRQAIDGDCTDSGDGLDMHALEGYKWAEWMRMKGVTKEMAKRRFIT